MILTAALYFAVPTVGHAGDPLPFEAARFLEAFGQHSRLHGLEVERATFNDVWEVFGNAAFFDHEYGETVCYVPEQGPAAVLVFWSYRDAHKPDDRINDFTVQGPGIAPDKADIRPEQLSRCAKSALVSDGIGTQGGLHLNMSRGDVSTLLGKPSTDNGDTVIYDAERETLPAEYRDRWGPDEIDPWTETNTIFLEFDDMGQLVQFNVGRVTMP